MSPEHSLRFSIALFAWLFSCAAGSTESAHEPVPASTQAPAIGATTANLLELQRSGLAAGKMQPIGGDVAGRSYKRYLESFERPIPEGRDGSAPASTPTSGKSASTTGVGSNR